MVGPAATERGHVQAVIFQDRIYERQIGDVIFRFILLDRRNAAMFAEVCNSLVEVLIVFFPEDPFEFLAVVAGAGFETLVAV